MEIRFDYGTEQRWKINQLAQEQNISVAEATKIFKSQQEECLQKLGLDMGEQPISLGVDQSETNEFTPYTNESAQIPQADEGIGKRINTKDEASVLTFFGLATYSNLREPEKYFEFKKDKNGNITDVYPKNSNDNIFIPDRFSLRYDKDGNLAQSFIQDIDENGNVKGQEITNYNADGTPKNTLYYTYQFDENGNQIG